ncbi:hypothetical protein O1L52_11750 [Pseudomonas aeruginosa]|uniref:hypothetical protein n=1 Tax=Pseudomonas aeruginosa TaxID=287 RepID=UPI000F51DE6E|nr:hypothetical protein [Pseudomonas aeruginosa]MCO2082441.1 hypothetical protein [Pseudomonas aeruginosa]RQC39525.1 hypothetical protein IPC390_14435 [Pseudomonas aeruginosa]
MREEFEAWHHAEFGYVIAVEDDPQQDGQCAKRWKAWQASRAALRVELPDDGIEDCQRDWKNSCRDTFDTGYCYATDRITKVLQQAGIEVKDD